MAVSNHHAGRSSFYPSTTSRLMKELKVRLMERMRGAELAEHLGYEPHGEPAEASQPTQWSDA